jgi:hypothetical protein
MRLSARLPWILSLSLATAACGGGGGSGGGSGTPAPTTTSAALGPSMVLGSGVVWANGNVEPGPGTLFAGENNNEARLFLTFYLGATGNRTVESADLWLTVESVLGDPVAPPIGGFLVESVDIGADLETFDYDLPAIGPTVAMDPTTPPVAIGGIPHYDVAPLLAEALRTGRDRITFRLRIAGVGDGDGFPDGWRFAIGAVGFSPLEPLFELTVR